MIKRHYAKTKIYQRKARIGKVCSTTVQIIYPETGLRQTIWNPVNFATKHSKLNIDLRCLQNAGII